MRVHVNQQMRLTEFDQLDIQGLTECPICLLVLGVTADWWLHLASSTVHQRALNLNARAHTGFFLSGSLSHPAAKANLTVDSKMTREICTKEKKLCRAPETQAKAWVGGGGGCTWHRLEGQALTEATPM